MSAHTTTLEFFGSAPVEFGSFPAESFTDWLGAVCMNVADPLLLPQMRDVTAEDFAAQSPAAVLALAMDEGQPDRTRLAALGALRIAFDAYAEEAAKKRDLLHRQMGDPMEALRAMGVKV